MTVYGYKPKGHTNWKYKMTMEDFQKAKDALEKAKIPEDHLYLTSYGIKRIVPENFG